LNICWQRDKAVEILKSFEEKKKKAASKTCHRCGHVAQVNKGFRCPKCGMECDRDLNACINIAHALTRGMGWGAWLLNRQIKEA
jgi:transposase